MTKEKLCITVGSDIVLKLKERANKTNTSLSATVERVLIIGMGEEERPTDILLKVKRIEEFAKEVGTSIQKARAKKEGLKKKEEWFRLSYKVWHIDIIILCMTLLC